MELRRRFSYANVMSTLAVFLGIAGGSVALASVPDNNSVDSSVVIDESLKSRDLKDGQAVESSDVVDETLGSNDLAQDSVGSSEIATDGVTAADIDSGAVTGSEIADNAVGSTEVANDAIGTAEVASGAVASNEVVNASLSGVDIADGGIDGSEFGDEAFYRVASAGVSFDDVDSGRNGDYSFAEASVNCSAGGHNGELISGSGKWTDDGNPGAGDELVLSEIRLNMDTEDATVVGGNDSGDSHTLVAEAICLSY